MGSSRDYYADLELSSAADIPEIKKQFRKLALKYHPDRNPGKEQEVNSKFQIIQAAHEILSDPEQKAKFDASRTKSRYPGASGVRGNPWADMASHYPPPPRRNPNPNPPPRNPPSGAQRWQTRFSTGVPPTAKQYNSADPEAKKNAARAFENMRKGQPGTAPKNAGRDTSRPVPPPPPPPRTESARQRQQAAFGANRKTGFHPRSTGDEPPVSNRNYATRAEPAPAPQQPEPVPQPDPKPVHEQRCHHPGPMPDPLKPFREEDNTDRQSTPYSTNGGEKTKPFDGIPMGRARSTRESTRKTESASSDDGSSSAQRHRSASVPKSTKEEAEFIPAGLKVPDYNAENGNTIKRKIAKPSRTRTGLRSDSQTQSNQASAPNDQTPAPEHNLNDQSTKPHPKGPLMYDIPLRFQKSYSFSSYSTYVSTYSPAPESPQRSLDGNSPESSPSGRKSPPVKLTSFERKQHRLLNQLINNVGAGQKDGKSRGTPTISEHQSNMNNANPSDTSSFNFHNMGGNLPETTTRPNSSARSSVDDIDTKFVNDDEPRSWQFSAGGSDHDEHLRTRSQSSGRRSRGSPSKRPPVSRGNTPSATSEHDKSEGGFDPDEWNFQPEIFSLPRKPTSGSPTRPSRAGSKKARSTKATVGTAVIIDDSSSDDDSYKWRGRKPQGEPTVVESPQAMDVDSPPRASATPSPQPNGVRNIHVEPSRPEWRSGNVDGAKDEVVPAEAPTRPFNPNAAGSEDSDEFRATLADLKNVAPFVQELAGLESFTDLKDTLPFESRPSEEIPIPVPQARPLDFPAPPAAPRPPPIVDTGSMKLILGAWEKYVKDFQAYIQQWDLFNSLVVDHFATRKANIARNRENQGFSFLDARGDGGVQEYCNWVQQDNDVRRRWNAACDEHEERFREFMAFRQKMK